MVHPDPELLLHTQFEAQARRTPAAIALHQGDRSISFAELEELSARVAAGLRALGIGQRSTVGLHVERSIEWVIGTLGILRTQAALMPLPPSYPTQRLQDILSDAALDGVVDAAGSRLPRSFGVRTAGLEDLLSSRDPLPEPGPHDPDQTAFVLCSSGSTGRPKMIARSHRSFFHRLQWTWEQHPYEAGEIGCQKAHATTTHGIYELFEPLLRGVPVLLIPDDEVRDLESFWETIRARDVTRLLIVPSMLQASLDMPGFVAPPLKIVVLMGEYVPPGLAGRALAAFAPSTHLYSIYGSTEASSTLVCDLRRDLRAGEELPLGTPISAEVRARVLGPDLAPIEAGESGRLYIAGPALFSGYFRHPELTAGVLVEAPVSGEKLYDTHDEVRQMPDGSIRFIGRTDDMVKVRGFRVDLQEVERTLLLHPGVRQAAVVVDDTPPAGASLVAFHAPADVDPDALYRTLRDRLPDYMVPSALIGLDAFPLSVRGKLDRARLLQEHRSSRPAAAPGRLPTDTERRVMQAWSAVLGHGRFALDSSYFEVGGTSLTAFALAHRLREAFSLRREQLPEQSIYRSPTVETLAGCIDGILGGAPEPAASSTPLLVTLKQGSDPGREPLFLIASAGGTLGAYEKLARALTTPREIIGVRDPFLWGERDPSESFDRWVGRYLSAIRERQPHGPYYIGAYSSAGAFGYEIARLLREAGEEVALLVLIDPLALDRGSKWRYGWWALRATYAHPVFRRLVRTAGRIRRPVIRMALASGRHAVPAARQTWSDQGRKMAENARRDRTHLLTVSTLLELNTGLPFALTESDFAGLDPDQYLGVLLARASRLMPDVDPAMLSRIVSQYPLQVRAQHAYQLRPYDGPVFLVEPRTRYAGLLVELLRPYLQNLLAFTIEISRPSRRNAEISARFGALEAHYRGMRDNRFVEGLSVLIEPALE